MNGNTIQSDSSRIVQSMAGMLFFRLGGQVVTFAILAILARYLGPEQFGVYSTLMVFLGFCAILLAPSLNDLLIRQAINARPNQLGSSVDRAMLRIGYGSRFLLALLALTAALIIGLILNWRGLDPFLIAVASVTLFTSLTAPSYRIAYEAPLLIDFRADIAAGINFAGRLILLLALVVAIWAGALLGGIIQAQIIGESGAFILLLILLGRSGYSLKPAFKSQDLRQLLVLSAPLITAEALTITYTRLDVLLLTQFAGPREAGLFAGPVRIIDGLQIIPTVILASLVPVFNRMLVAKPANFDRTVGLSARALWALGIFFAISISPFASPLINMLFGREFSESAVILRLGIFCAPLVFAGALLPALLIVSGAQKVIPLIYFQLAVVNIGMNYLLIPQYGGTGAIIAKLVTYALPLPIALIWRSSRKIGAQILTEGVLPFSIALLAAYYLPVAGMWVGFGLPLVAIATFSAIWFSGWFGASKLKEIKEILSGRFSTDC